MTRALAFAAAAGLLAALCAGQALAQTPPAPTEAEQIAHGRMLVTRNCGMCHAVGESGLSRDPQAPPFRQLHERYDVEMIGEALAEGILTGHPAMPEFRFEPNEIVAIIRFLRSVQTKDHAGGDALPVALR